MKKCINNKIVLFVLLFIGTFIVSNKSYASDNQNLKDSTRVYFSAEASEGKGCGDCILLENYDENGEKVYGLIDAGNKVIKNDKNGEESTAVKEFLKAHGVENLEFFAITHCHGDHLGDAITVLDNFDIKKLYIKEFDAKWSPDGIQSAYEDIIERAVTKNIKVIGVSYLSLNSKDISPSRSTDFVNNTKNAKEKLFESFYYNSESDNNIIFKFGSSTIRIYNWEMFTEEGKQYTTGITTDKTREIDANENNNTITFLLTQGNKKAFFSGDLNNLDKNDSTGRIGDEDRIKNQIGKIDMLKVGHHGYEYSNTEDYMNVLHPEYAVITNDIGRAYKDVINWLETNNVNYLYTTSDECGISATITDDNVYLGFETTGKVKNINGKLYYIPNGKEYEDYMKNLYKIQYQEKNVQASSWNELKNIIENNKDEIVKIDDEKKECTLFKLIINLNNSENWIADNTIKIENQQNVVLTSTENVTILRGINLKDAPIFWVKGILDIGTENMNGKITLDGNKNNVESISTLIKIEKGYLNLYNNVTLCNNMNKIQDRTGDYTTQDYSAFGSAIYADVSTINMYGGEIINNSQYVYGTHILPRVINNNYFYDAKGCGIYMSNNSTLNMYGGKISHNEAENHSVVETYSQYSSDKKSRTISQRCIGVGIFASLNSYVNLFGGEITENAAKNCSKITLSTATIENQQTNIHTLVNGIYGAGINVDSSELKIKNNFVISGNSAIVNSNIILNKDTAIKSSAASAIRGQQVYINNATVEINGANISGGTNENNTTISNNGSIGTNGKGTVSTVSIGGGIDLTGNTKFDINNLTIGNCESDRGAGLYVSSSNGKISNSSFANNTAKENGGAIYTANEATSLELNNIKVINNKAENGSGGGIFAYGTITILGGDTEITNNIAKTYGGGMHIKTKLTMEDGKINTNIAQNNAGGGIRVDGILFMNGGNISKNSAKTTGGGVDYTSGEFYKTKGQIKNNLAEGEGNEIYPINNTLVDTIKPTLNIGEIIEEWTNKKIVVRITAEDNETGINTVTVNNKKISGTDGIYNFTATENGTYQVIAEDNQGNTTIKQFTIAKIDKVMPIITGVSNNVIYNGDITINTTDNLSGIKSITLMKNDKKIEYTLGDKITESGNYVIKVEDNASNVNIIKFIIDKSLKEEEIMIDEINKNWSNDNQSIKIKLNKAVKSIKVDGIVVSLIDGEYTIVANQNKSYKIEIIDLEGNTITKVIEVVNIDKENPEILGVIDQCVYNERVNLTVRDQLSGIYSLVISKDGNERTYTEEKIELTENGNYELRAIDNAGNESKMNFKIQIKDEPEKKELDKEKNASEDLDEVSRKQEEVIEKAETVLESLPKEYVNHEIYNVDSNEKKLATKMLPNTGFQNVSIILLGITIIFSLFNYIKLKRSKDIK